MAREVILVARIAEAHDNFHSLIIARKSRLVRDGLNFRETLDLMVETTRDFLCGDRTSNFVLVHRDDGSVFATGHLGRGVA